LGTEDDDLLREDVNTWDIFNDYSKFKMRDELIRERKKKSARKEIEAL
jgi:hypothetical protein